MARTTTIPQAKKPVAEMRHRTRRAHKRKKDIIDLKRACYDLPTFTDKQIRSAMSEDRTSSAAIIASVQKAREAIIDKSAAVDRDEMTIVDRDEPVAYHPDYGWLYTDNEYDKMAFGFNPHRHLNWTVESKRFKVGIAVRKQVKTQVKTISTRGIFSVPPTDPRPRPKRVLNRDEYRERSLSAPIPRRRR